MATSVRGRKETEDPHKLGEGEKRTTGSGILIILSLGEGNLIQVSSS